MCLCVLSSSVLLVASVLASMRWVKSVIILTEMVPVDVLEQHFRIALLVLQGIVTLSPRKSLMSCNRS